MSEIWQAVQTEQAPFNGLPLIKCINNVCYIFVSLSYCSLRGNKYIEYIIYHNVLLNSLASEPLPVGGRWLEQTCQLSNVITLANRA